MSTQTMKAARWHAAKDIRVEETVIPTPNDDQLKSKLSLPEFAVLICTSTITDRN